MIFIKHPTKIKYLGKGNNSIYHIVKIDDKYCLYSEHNNFLYSSNELKNVKSMAKSIDQDNINNCSEN